MLIRLRGTGCPNSNEEKESLSKPSLVLKGQPYFYNTSPMANSKSVLRIWRATNEKVWEIKSSICARHRYDTLFIGGQDRKMGLVIRFRFYRLALSKFLSSEEVWNSSICQLQSRLHVKIYMTSAYFYRPILISCIKQSYRTFSEQWSLCPQRTVMG